MNTGLYGYSPNSTAAAIQSLNGVTAPVAVRALVVGGGGGSAQSYSDTSIVTPSGGGGGGGVIDETVLVSLSSAITIQIGAGSTAVGSFSRFGSLFAIGGGFSAYYNGGAGRGATGGAQNLLASAIAAATSLVSPQGFSGGTGSSNTFARADPTRPGGGGGAGAIGNNGTAGGAAGDGGAGRLSTVPLVASHYGGGGGGGGCGATFAAGSGGIGGGANGNPGGTSGSTYPGVAAAANTGGGAGGGGGVTNVAGGNQIFAVGSGGSGVVVLRFNAALVFRVTSGLTFRQESAGSETILTFTAGLGTITFS